MTRRTGKIVLMLGLAAALLFVAWVSLTVLYYAGGGH
jgi:hypothetical protein